MYFVKNLLLYHGERSIQTKCVVMMTKEGSTKILNFMTPGGGVRAQVRDLISHSENALFLLKSSSLLPDIEQTN